jgi:hypothetical protein
VHPALKDWEEGNQTPTAPYREAIEVWTGGKVRAASWPLEGREKKIADNAAKVGPAVVPPAPSSSTDDVDDNAA